MYRIMHMLPLRWQTTCCGTYFLVCAVNVVIQNTIYCFIFPINSNSILLVSPHSSHISMLLFLFWYMSFEMMWYLLESKQMLNQKFGERIKSTFVQRYFCKMCYSVAQCRNFLKKKRGKIQQSR